MSRRKYGNIPQMVDGIRFASRREARRYGELKLLEAAGEITGLLCHPPFRLEIGGQFIATYTADFSYFERDGRYVVEDTKGVRTQVYSLKKRMVKALYGIDIREV